MGRPRLTHTHIVSKVISDLDLLDQRPCELNAIVLRSRKIQTLRPRALPRTRLQATVPRHAHEEWFKDLERLCAATSSFAIRSEHVCAMAP